MRQTPDFHRLATVALAATGLACAIASPAAWAQNDALLRCPRLADRDARLACYDAILPPNPAPAPAPAPAAGAASAAIAARVPPVAVAAVALPATAPVAPPGAAADSAQTFGLTRARPGEVQSIDTEVLPGFDGWGPNQRIRLANKQVWRVDDSSSGSIDPSKRKVTVRRGLLGSFFLEFEGLTKSPRVSRLE